MSCTSRFSRSSTPFLDARSNTDKLQETYSLKLPILLKEDLGIDFEDFYSIGAGSFNVIFGYTKKADRSRYVIRASIYQAKDETNSEPGPNLKDQAALLQFLEPWEFYLGSIPKTVHVDATNNNRLGRPYMIQTFIYGDTLSRIEDREDLSDDDYRDLIYEVVELSLKLERFQFYRSGTLCAQPANADGIDAGRFKSDTDELDTIWPPDLAIHQWLLHLLNHQEQRYHKQSIAIPDSQDHELNQLERLRTIVSEMHSVGIFNDPRGVQRMSKAVLCHPDLHFGNLFAERTVDTKRLQISGVIDWDNAAAKPLQLAREPPYWLWQPEETWDEDCDYIASEYWELMDEQQKNFKRVFDEAMCSKVPGYWDDAYGAGLWIRRVAKIAMWGFSQEYQDSNLKWLCEEWVWYMEKELGRESGLRNGGNEKKNGSRVWQMVRQVRDLTSTAAALGGRSVLPLVGLVWQLSKWSFVAIGWCLGKLLETHSNSRETC
ncbi:MAG: hypothetical protein M1831_006376 [Alyxoria varia]|nr:MAG: hypothetical protein M1831_006376 [Alyxoria varia]